MTPPPIRTLLADDHRIFCDSVEHLLKESTGFQVVKKYYSGTDLLRDFHQQNGDLLLLDIELPGVNGLDVLKRIRLKNSVIKIVMLSMHEESMYSRYSIENGANAYLSKTTEGSLIVGTLLSVLEGKESPERPEPLPPERGLLSTQEIRVLRMLTDGKTSAEISSRLAISALTVKTHRQNMMRKLNVGNTAGLIGQAFARGFSELS